MNPKIRDIGGAHCLARFSIVGSREKAFDPGASNVARQDATLSIAFQYANTLGRIRQLQEFRGSIPFKAE